MGRKIIIPLHHTYKHVRFNVIFTGFLILYKKKLPKNVIQSAVDIEVIMKLSELSVTTIKTR